MPSGRGGWESRWHTHATHATHFTHTSCRSAASWSPSLPPLLLLLLPLSLGTCQRPSPPPLRGTHRTAAVPGRSCCGSWRAEPTSMAHLQPHVRGSAPTPCRPVRAGRVCQLSEPACQLSEPVCQLSGATACQLSGATLAHRGSGGAGSSGCSSAQCTTCGSSLSPLPDGVVAEAAPPRRAPPNALAWDR
eukprot:SAG25_NODE_895_length_4876_cov_4.475822_3_plen_190_part_00